MRRGALKTLTAGSAIVLSLAASVQLAQAQPDLVIQRSDSEMEFVSCEKAQPLVRGRIVIRNEGDSDANLRQAGDLFRSFLAVYNPENIDLIKKAKKRTKMEPREQRAISIEVGAGKTKAGRNYNGFPRSTDNGDDGDDGSNGDDGSSVCKKVLSRDEAKGLQQFLKDRDLYSSGIDGSFGAGSIRALKRYQKVSGIKPANGQCDAQTMDAIAKASGSDNGGTATTVVSSNIKDSQGRTKITIFAVVDPYNLIDESNEANNIVAYTGWLACD